MKNNKLRCTAPRSEDAELRAMQAEIERLNGYVQKANMDVTAACVERDKALARLAITEEANSMLLARNKWLEHALEAAGASPVEPSQALSLDLLERLNKTLTRLGYATPEGGMEHFNADLANQLYNLCRAVDSIFDREQPPAPGEAAREYMTGYSDGREWAQPSQAVELSQQEAEALAHRRASKYAHRSDSSYVAYTFLPHTLMDFVRDVTAAINAKDHPNG